MAFGKEGCTSELVLNSFQRFCEISDPDDKTPHKIFDVA